MAADYLTGVGTNLFNPKVGIFFVSFLPVFIPRGASVAPASLMLGGIFLAEGIVWLTAIVWLAARLSAIFPHPLMAAVPGPYHAREVQWAKPMVLHP